MGARILRVVTRGSATGAYGGPFTTALAQSEALAATGCQVTLFAGVVRGDSPILEGERSHLTFVFPVARNTSLLPVNVGFVSFRALRKLWESVRRANVVHISYAREVIPLLAALLGLALHKRLVLQTHGMLLKDDRKVVRVLDFLVVRPLFRRAKVVIALTGSEREALRAWCWQLPAVETIGNTVDLVEAKRVSAETSLNSPPVILFMARLHPRKRVTDFLAAAAIASARGWADRYVVMGPDGGDLDAVRAASQTCKNLSYDGPCAPERVLAAIAGATVFVQTSRDEPWGNLLAGALALGTPLIVTQSAALAPLIHSFGAGLVVPDECPSAVAEAAHALLYDDVRRTELRAAALSLAANHLSRNDLGVRLQDVLIGAV